MLTNPEVFNESEVRQALKLRATKLRNLKEHLQALIDKKIRLEFEIKSLEKSIKNKQRSKAKSLKLRVGLEASEALDSQTKAFLVNQLPEVNDLILEGDNEVIELVGLLESIGLPEKEAKDLRSIL